MKKDKHVTIQEKQPSALVGGIILLCAVAIIMWGALLHGFDVTVFLFIGAGLVCAYGVFVQKIHYSEMEKAAISSIASAMDALLVIMSIGMVVGSFIACGTIPYIISLGLALFTPVTFLPILNFMGGILSAITGSSWVVVGTIGLAGMGIGEGMGIPAPITAGCVLCGAYMGDKISPLSGDAPNFFAAVSKVDLFHHCKMSLYSTIPTWIVSIIIFAIIGMSYSNKVVDEAALMAIRDGLADVFDFGFWLWIPIIYLIVVTLLKVPAVPAIATAGFLGFICTIIFQGTSPADSMTYLISGYVGETSNDAINNILSRGGMTGMFGTVGIVIAAMMFAGFIERSGLLIALSSKLSKLISGRVGLILTSFFTGLVLCFACADTFFTCTVVAKAFDYKYDELHLDRAVLSRTMGDFATTCCPLVPWSINGVYCATTLGVSTLAYTPFYFMAILAPIMCLVTAITGWGLRYVDENGNLVKKLPKKEAKEA
ncbi:MAG: Na+/H+ antiporter NhaC family protein [Lachnospiraceae bacterium]|nr:Na+/H+ antiporter NhaC family protein [Lachnospiraceae bacterium]